jgi:hypothetical protein
LLAARDIWCPDRLSGRALISISQGDSYEQDNGVVVTQDERIITSGYEQEMVNGYLYWTSSVDWAVGAEYRLENITTKNNRMREIDTVSVPVGVRYFHHSGSFAVLTTTFVHQDVEFSRDSGLRDQTDTFFVLDAGVGYRFPNRGGLISLEARNLLNKKFNFQDLSFLSSQPDLPLSNKRFVPARTFIGRFTVNF